MTALLSRLVKTTDVETKPSGVDWVGDVPAHWSIEPLGARYDVQLGKMLNPSATAGLHPAPYLRNANVQWDHVRLDDLAVMDFDPGERVKFELRPGDLLICEGGDVGRTAMWRGELKECFFQKAIHRVRPKGDGDVPRFLYYLMYATARRGVFRAEGNKSTIVHLTADQLRRHRFAFPPREEQEEIAARLDEVNAHLTLLEAELRGIAELAEEKRAATIFDVVTKGVEVSASKASGLAWIGEIPAHWEVLSLKHVLRSIEQGWSPQCENRQIEHGEWGVLKLSAVTGGTFRLEEHKVLPLELTPRPSLTVRAGDVLVTRANTRALVGAAALVKIDAPTMMISDLMYRLRAIPERILPEFLVRLLQSPVGRAVLERNAAGSNHSMVKISKAELLNLSIPLPPPEEQQVIVSHLDVKISDLDALAEEARASLELVQEQRTALVTAAVTGKVNVRAPGHP